MSWSQIKDHNCTSGKLRAGTMLAISAPVALSGAEDVLEVYTCFMMCIHIITHNMLNESVNCDLIKCEAKIPLCLLILL